MDASPHVMSPLDRFVAFDLLFGDDVVTLLGVKIPYFLQGF